MLWQNILSLEGTKAQEYKYFLNYRFVSVLGIDPVNPEHPEFNKISPEPGSVILSPLHLQFKFIPGQWMRYFQEKS